VPLAPTLSGILPATLTPVDPSGRFVESIFARLLERLYAAGSDGIYVNGYSGEGLQQTLDQRMAVAEAAVRHSPPGRTVVVHVGSARVDDAFELARHARAAGAHALASVPPFGADVFEDEIGYFSRLVAVTDLPVLLYYLPGVCGERTLDQIRAICRLDGIVGLKYSSTNVYAISELAREGHIVFNGCDELLTAAWMMGAAGGVGGFFNLVPGTFVEIGRAAGAGEWTRAQSVQRDLNALISAVLGFPLLASLKQLMAWGGLDCGPPLAPKRPLGEQEAAALREAVTATALGAALVGGEPVRG
jgi:N-acetylneuraminate lyase